jgi:hypothetical protein
VTDGLQSDNPITVFRVGLNGAIVNLCIFVDGKYFVDG